MQEELKIINKYKFWKNPIRWWKDIINLIKDK